ncbi:MAG: RNA polymerase subunit sigma-24 [Citrobacter freundii]|nr:MAG: RNA polymerase subunit sigma-24 [Citrobacter freundii]
MDFDEIYTRYAERVYRICRGYTNDQEQAKDLVQETFIAVWKNLSRFEGRSEIGTWIFRIATNNCLRAMEKERRMPRAELPTLLTESTQETKAERLQSLYDAIATLPELDRLIIALTLEDLPQLQIAEIVGLSHGSVRLRVHRIKEKLTQKINVHGRNK